MQPCSDLPYYDDIVSALDSRGYVVKDFSRIEILIEWLHSIGSIINVSDIKVNSTNRTLLCSDQTMPFHTDHPDANIIAWYCVAQSAYGGASVLVDTQEIISALDESQLRALNKVKVKVPAMEKKGISEIRSLFSAAGVYYANWLLVDAKDSQQIKVLNQFMDLVANAPKINIQLQPGQALIVNNNRMLHGREAFQNTSTERHLIRYWVSASGVT